MSLFYLFGTSEMHSSYLYLTYLTQIIRLLIPSNLSYWLNFAKHVSNWT